MHAWAKRFGLVGVGLAVSTAPVFGQADGMKDMATFPRPIAMADNVWIEELTMVEVRDLLASGTETALILTGGIEENGPYVISSLHYIYDKIRQYGGEPPHHLQGMWDDYAAVVEQTPEHTRHLRIHDGHCTFLRDDERPFVTEELLRGTCVVGSPQEIADKLRDLEAAGLDEIMMLPAPGTQVRVAEQFAAEVLPLLAA